MSYPRIYNAAVDMVDRNVAEGRGDKTAFIDPQRDADLWRACRPLQPHGQPARHLRCSTRVPRCPAAAGYRRFSRRVLGRHQGRRRAGVPQYAADERAVRLHPRRQPRQGAIHLGAAASRSCSRSSASCRSSSTSSCAAAKPPPFALSFRSELHLQAKVTEPPTPAATRPRSGSTRRAPPACPRACATCTRAPWKRRAYAASTVSACARTISSSPPPSCSSPTASATPCRFPCRSAPRTVLVPDRPTPEAGVPHAQAASADLVLRRADALRGDAGLSAGHAREQLAAPAPVRLGRRGAARPRSARHSAPSSGSTFLTASAPPRCCTSTSATARSRLQIRHLRQAGAGL